MWKWKCGSIISFNNLLRVELETGNYGIYEAEILAGNASGTQGGFSLVCQGVFSLHGLAVHLGPVLQHKLVHVELPLAAGVVHVPAM